MAAEIKPALVGVSILTTWSAFLLCTAAVLNWWSHGWKAPTDNWKHNSVRLLLVVSLALLVGFEFTFLYNGSHHSPCTATSCGFVYSFVGSSWVWLGNNMILVTLAIATVSAARSGLSGRGLVADLIRKQSFAQLDDTPQSQLASVFLGSEPERQYLLGSPTRQAALLYAASLCVLIAYMILNQFLSINAPDSGK